MCLFALSGCLFFEGSTDGDDEGGAADAAGQSDVAEDVMLDGSPTQDVADVGEADVGADTSDDVGDTLDPDRLREALASQNWATLFSRELKEKRATADLLAMLRFEDSDHVTISAAGFVGEGDYTVTGRTDSWELQIGAKFQDASGCSAIEDLGNGGVARACEAWVSYYSLTNWEKVELTGQITPANLQNNILPLHRPGNPAESTMWTPTSPLVDRPPEPGTYVYSVTSPEMEVKTDDAAWTMRISGDEDTAEYGQLIRFGHADKESGMRWGVTLGGGSGAENTGDIPMALVGGALGERGFTIGGVDFTSDALHVPLFSDAEGGRSAQVMRHWFGQPSSF
jgi:hypothetical protein